MREADVLPSALPAGVRAGEREQPGERDVFLAVVGLVLGAERFGLFHVGIRSAWGAARPTAATPTAAMGEAEGAFVTSSLLVSNLAS